MKREMVKGDRYPMQFELGFYYMGYENPDKVINHEQKFCKNEWTIFIRTKNPTFRPYISQFIDYVDFNIPKYTKVITVKAPE